jgi:hypothetical protein
MAFEITDLMIQVVTGSPHADKGAATHCETHLTCKPKDSPTHCADNVTCVGVKPTHCQKVTCQPDKKTSAEAELDALLEQLRATLAETATV